MFTRYNSKYMRLYPTNAYRTSTGTLYFPLSVPDTGTGLDDTKSNKLSVTINPIVAVTIRFSLNYFPNLLSKNICLTEESRYYLCRQMVQQFDCPIDRAVFTDICVLFPGPNITTVIIPAQVA